MSKNATRVLVLPLLIAGLLSLSAGCSDQGSIPAQSLGGTFEGTVTQVLRGTPAVQRESTLRVVFDDEGRLISWQGEARRSYVLARLLEEQRCEGADIEALLAPEGVLQISCPDDLQVTFRTLEYRTRPDFGLVVELGSDVARGRGSELYRLTEAGLEVDIFVQVLFEQEEGEPLRFEQRISGLLQRRL